MTGMSHSSCLMDRGHQRRNVGFRLDAKPTDDYREVSSDGFDGFAGYSVRARVCARARTDKRGYPSNPSERLSCGGGAR